MPNIYPRAAPKNTGGTPPPPLRLRRFPPLPPSISPLPRPHWIQIHIRQRGQKVVRVQHARGDRPRFFSPGFDVTEVFTYRRDQISAFLNQFALLMDHLQWMPKPTVAALSGHTYAGGALAALCTDFRLMADSSDYGFALTEVNIGVRLPASVFLLLSNAAGVPLARRSFLTGDPIRPAEGLNAGLFHALCPEAEVSAQSIALATYLATKPPATYAAIKEKVLLTAGHRRLDASTNWIDPEAWFTPEAEQMKRQLAEKLKR